MARTAIAVQEAGLAGLTPSYTAAIADGHMFVPTGSEIIHVKNTGGAPITLTVQTPAKAGGIDIAEITVSVPATTGDKMIGIKDVQYFRQTDGNVYIDTSAQTGVTYAVIRRQ